MARRAFEDFSRDEILNLFEAFAEREGFEHADGHDGQWRNDPRGGLVCRMKSYGDKRGESSAYAHLYFDGAANGWIKDFRGDRHTWRIWEDDAAKAQAGDGYQFQKLTDAERAARDDRRRREQAERQRAADEATAAAKARMLEEYQAAPEASSFAVDANAGGLEYIRRKGVFAARGSRLDFYGNLLIPYYTTRGEFVLFQRISTGNKTFPHGARFPDSGAAFWIGSTDGRLAPPGPLDGIGNGPPVLALCEGYATACSFYRAAGIPTATTGNASNIERTARAFLSSPAWKEASFILAADDDFITESEGNGNAGIEHARAARSACAPRVFIARPPWDQEKEIAEYRRAVAEIGKEHAHKPSDWNDYALKYGMEAAQAAARDAVRAALAYFARMKG